MGNRAKLSLRALGSTQLAYQDQNLHKCYATCTNLTQTEYLQAGYTRGNCIDNYSMAVWHCTTPEIVNGQSAQDASFTMVALPRNNRNKLRTFAICDDQTLRVATDYMLDVPSVPEGQVPAPTPNYDPCSWEPLR